MRKIIYHVATTLDNYIAHEDGSVDGFLNEGEHVIDFLNSFQEYDSVLMGKKTYEYGFQFGLKIGEPAYQPYHLKNYIFSKTMKFDSTKEVELIDKDEISFIKNLKQKEGKNIWLCGGGDLAGSLLDNHLIDELIIKLNPIIFGQGISLFGESRTQVTLEAISSKFYNNGVNLLHYKLKYGSK